MPGVDRDRANIAAWTAALVGGLLALEGCAHTVGRCETDESLCLAAYEAAGPEDQAGFDAHLARWAQRCERETLYGWNERAACTAVARLRAGSTLGPDGERLAYELAARHAPKLIEPDVAQAIRIVQRQCPNESDRFNATCEMRRYLVGQFGLLDESDWVTPGVALALMRHLLGLGASQAPDGDDPTWRALSVAQDATPDPAQREEAEAVAALAADLRGQRYRREAPAVRAAIAEVLAAGLEQPPEVFAAALRDLRGRLRDWPDAERSIALAPITQAGRELLERQVRDRIARRAFGHVAQLENLAKTAGLDRSHIEMIREELQLAGRAFHALEAERHEAAGRRAAASVHGALAARYGGGDRRIDPALTGLDFRLRETGAARVCPWVALPVSPAPTGTTVVEVAWSVCDAAERHWTTRDVYTYLEVASGGGGGAVSTPQAPDQKRATYCATNHYCGPAPDLGTGAPPPSPPTYVRAEAKRETRRREVSARAGGTLELVVEGEVLQERFQEALALEEEAFDTPHGRKAFTALTREQQAAAVARALGHSITAALGRLSSRARALHARASFERALSLLEARPDEAEDALARALLYGLPDAAARFGASYGVTGPELLVVVDRTATRPAP